jgi:hypothetical protein
LSANGGIAPSLVGWASHIETPGGTAPGTFISVAELLGWFEVPNAEGADASEAEFLPQACQFARYLGSGKGTCACK